MTNREKSDAIQNKLNELLGYKTKLSDSNIDSFNVLKKEILELLDNNQKLRFNQINFYSHFQDYSNLDADDLPF